MPTLLLRYGSRGRQVRELQRLLNRNRYYKPRPRLVVDGVYGPRTASCVQAAKRRLGYEPDECLPVAGRRFLDYLSGATPLTAEMRKRRRLRLARLAELARLRSLRVKALALARDDIGTVEGPGNAVKYNKWWCGGSNDGGAYCVRACSFWYAGAGSSAVVRGSRWQNTDAMLADAASHRNGLRLVHQPLPGDVMLIDFDGHTDPDHAGLVERVRGGVVDTVEANATLADGRQGVGRHTRAVRNCWFVRVER